MSSEENKKARLTRRDFMKIAAIGGAAAAGSIALGGCDATAAPTDAPIVEQECPPAGVPATWDYEADVVVIGLGGAGASASIEAHDQGAKVLVLEKQPEDTHMCNSSMCGGLFHNPAPDGDREALKQLLKGMMSGDNLPWKLEGEQPDQVDEMVEIFAEYQVQSAAWLKSIEPDLHDESLAGSGESAFTMFPGGKEAGYRTAYVRYRDYEELDPVLDLHDRPAAPVLQKVGGDAWMHALVQVGMKERNIDILYGTPAKRLVERDGEILGVIAETGGTEIACKAKKAVIITSGGYEFNLEMRRAFLEGPGVKGWGFYGSPDNRGEGIDMAVLAGAGLAKVGKAASRIECAVPYGRAWEETGLKQGCGTNARYPNSFVIDNYGQRYCNEVDIYTGAWRYQFYKTAMLYDMYTMVYPRVPSWLIFDETCRARRPIGRGGPVRNGKVPWPDDNLDAIERGWILKADTLAGLVAKIKSDPENRSLLDETVLADSVDTFNSYCAAGEDADFGRDPGSMGPVETPPFYAIQLYPGGPNTKGGIMADAQRSVLTWEAKPIPRLYTAGEISSVFKFTYQGGGNVTECMVCGRIAGKNAAALTPWDEA